MNLHIYGKKFWRQVIVFLIPDCFVINVKQKFLSSKLSEQDKIGVLRLVRDDRKIVAMEESKNDTSCSFALGKEFGFYTKASRNRYITLTPCCKNLVR